MEATDKKEGIEKKENNDVFSQSVRAGKRTYFFDVKATKSNEYYLTLTESKKRFIEDGKFVYEKHKIFLYKEDFEKFLVGLNEVIKFVNENSPEPLSEPNHSFSKESKSEFTNVNFEDLDK